MTQEREHNFTATAPSTTADDDAPIAGRISRSSLLRKPDHPLLSGLLSRKARDSNGVAEGAEHAVAQASSSSGSALPDTLMRKFEASLGADLSGVRVHTGGESASASEAVGARAYTMGQDIHFGAGQYNPSSREGEHLLAHEVAHTVQQAGSTPSRQHKLEVSAPGDALEHAADAAADAMVAGQPASVGGAGAGVSRKLFRDVDSGYGGLAVAGDTAANAAMGKKLDVDSISVTADIKDVNNIVADIKKNSTVLEAARDVDIPRKQEYVAVNAEAATKLSIFKDKLNVSSVDTSAFAVQYRIANADFARLSGAAHEMMLHVKTQSGDELGTVTEGIGKVSGMKLDASAELNGFEQARIALNSAAKNMNLRIKTARDAANALQSGVYKTQAAVAAATGASAANDLKSIKEEIAATAAGVGRVVKLVTAVAGFAGSGGAFSAAATPTLKEPTSVKVEGADVGNLEGTSLGAILKKEQTVDIDDPAKSAAFAIAKGVYSDAGKFNVSDNATAGAILGGDPAKMAEALVTAIGEYANRKKIQRLETIMTVASTQASVLTAESEKLDMVSKQGALETAAAALEVEVTAFAFAKTRVVEKRDALMEKLAKSGKKGSDQAKIVLFLTDADRFLAQVDNAIAVGKNQQDNMELAAADRKSLRGTDKGLGEDADRNTQRYYQCTKLGKKPWNAYGDFYYSTPGVYVKFTEHEGFVDPNAITQGGAGTVEGVGGAADSVASKIELLKKKKLKIQQLQTACQDALYGKGKGKAG